MLFQQNCCPVFTLVTLIEEIETKTNPKSLSASGSPILFCLIYLFACLFIYLFIYLLIYLFIYLFIFLLICLLIYLFIYLSIYLFIYLFTYLFIYLFIQLIFFSRISLKHMFRYPQSEKQWEIIYTYCCKSYSEQVKRISVNHLSIEEAG